MSPREIGSNIHRGVSKTPPWLTVRALRPPSLVVLAPVHWILTIVCILCRRNMMFRDSSCIGRMLLGHLQLGHCTWWRSFGASWAFLRTSCSHNQHTPGALHRYHAVAWLIVHRHPLPWTGFNFIGYHCSAVPLLHSFSTWSLAPWTSSASSSSSWEWWSWWSWWSWWCCFPCPCCQLLSVGAVARRSSLVGSLLWRCKMCLWRCFHVLLCFLPIQIIELHRLFSPIEKPYCFGGEFLELNCFRGEFLEVIYFRSEFLEVNF